MAADIAVAVASWLLAEYFTRKSRMALPSIVLLLAYAGAVFLAVTEALGFPRKLGLLEDIFRMAGFLSAAWSRPEQLRFTTGG